MHLFLFLLFIITLIFTSLMINSIREQENLVSFLLGLMIINYGIVILISEVASIFHTITIPFLLTSLLVICILSWLIWRRQGKPSLLGPIRDGKWRIWREFPPFSSHPALYILAFGVIAVYLFGAGLIIALPQHNYDSMTYHLSRVGYWMQHQTLSPWSTPNPRQTTSPINAEVGLMWLVMFWGTDQLTGFVQWFAAMGIAIAIYGLARLMGATRPQSTFASLIWMTFPQIILQSTTTQNDLLASFFFLSMLYFLFLTLKSQKVGDSIFSGIALGLAVGTKVTTVIALPGLAIAVLIIWLLTGKRGFRTLLIWGVFCILGIGVLGSFTYVQNQVFYGDPISVPEWTSVNFRSISQDSRIASGSSKFLVYLVQFVDFSGIPESLAFPFNQLKMKALDWMVYQSPLHLKISRLYPSSLVLKSTRIIHEDTTWFGPLSFLLLIPGAIAQFFYGVKEKDYVRLSLITISISFLIAISFLISWSPYRGRYFVLFFSILAPMMAILYKPFTGKKLIYYFVSVLALWIMVSVLLQNATKPLIGENAVWGKDYMEIRMSNNQKMVPVLKMVDDYVPENAVLGTRLGVDHWDYVLFGKYFSRTLIPLEPAYPGIDQEFITDTGIEYLLVAPRERPFLEIPPRLVWLDDTSGWSLFSISKEVDAFPPYSVSEMLLGLQDEKGILEVDKTLTGIVGITELFSSDWNVETDGSGALKWLGEGLNQGLRAFLWSEKEIPIRVVFSLQPGPSRDDLERNLEIAYYRYGAYGPVLEGSVINSLQISGEYTYEMVVQLQKGLNEIRIFSFDRATIPVLPNGDERPLLVRLNDVHVLPFENEPQISLIDASLAGDLRVMEKYLPPWGLEMVADKPFLWLGEGIESGYRGFIWSEAEKDVRFVFYLVPGPSRGDLTRNLDITSIRPGYFEVSSAFHEVLTIDEPGQYEVEIKLYQGLNQLDLSVLDEATIETLPNGDPRPLLVQLTQIDILPIDD